MKLKYTEKQWNIFNKTYRERGRFARCMRTNNFGLYIQKFYKKRTL